MMKISSLYGDKMEKFVWGTLSTAVLDSGCTMSMCGNIWTYYLDMLKLDDMRKVETRLSSTIFKFGNGEQVKS